MKKLFYLIAFCLVGIALRATDAAAADDFVAAAKTIRANLARTHDIIVELSDIAQSEADKATMAKLVAVQQALEAELVQFDKAASNMTRQAALVESYTKTVNEAVRLYNSKCRGSTHPKCVEARRVIEAERAKIEEFRPLLEKMRLWTTDFKDRSGRWRSGLETDLKNIKKQLEGTAPLDELPVTNASAFTGASGDVPTGFEAASAMVASQDDGLDVSDLAQAVPESLQGSGTGPALPEVSTDEPAAPTWRWERVRVKRSFGPFCWTQCCWRKVKVAK